MNQVSNDTPNEVVVLVHGLWVNGREMGLLRRRLAAAGYRTRRFSYPSLANTPFENAMDLHRFIEGLDQETLHFVAHSLGGLVIRHLFYHFSPGRPGRAVTLGTPHQGSAAAAFLSRFAAGRLLLGKSIQHGLLGPLPPWPEVHELGSIAGITRLGLGLLLPGIPQPSDGTVAVAETRLAGMTDHVEVPASHSSMLWSKAVSRQAVHFLQNGRFDHASEA